MNDDIVTRLRGCWCGDGFANRGLVDPACDHDGIRAEAADEIERLRKAITDFIIKTSDSHCTWQMENDAIEELKKVVRGE